MQFFLRNGITRIEDKIEPSRTQEFLYDSQNRLTEAKGKYGVETYEYTDNYTYDEAGNRKCRYGEVNTECKNGDIM